MLKYQILKISFGICAVMASASCHKSNHTVTAPASVNIVNAVQGSPGIIPVFGTSSPIQYFQNAQTIGYESSLVFSPTSGNDTLYVVESNDTLNVNQKADLFYSVLGLKAGGIYSLFFSGDAPNIDTLLVEDYPPIHNDSVAGVRFVDLVTSSNSICVTIEGNSPAQTE